MDLTSLPSLNVDCFLALMQSFLLQHRRKKDFFPSMPVSEDRFGAMCCTNLCTVEEWHAIVHDMTAMFLLEDSRELLPILEYQNGATLAECAQAFWHLWYNRTRQVTFFTSGTTGKPHACIHTEAELKQEASFLRTLFSHNQAFLSSVSPHHLYGFTFGLYLPLVCGVPVRRTLSLSTLLISQIQCNDAVIGIPVLWNAVARGKLKMAKHNVSLISASAPINSETLDILERCGYLLIDVFGSSETGVIGIRSSSREPYRLLPYFDRQKSIYGGLLRILPDGSIREYPLMDNLDWQGTRKFYPAGRKDKAVQVAGVNVYPSHVAKQLENIPEIAMCAVRLTGKSEGSRLKAFIVLKEGVEESDFRKKLKVFLKNFSPEERPVHFKFGRDLPRNEMGKLQDW